MKLINLSNKPGSIKVDDENYNKLLSYSFGVYGNNKYPRGSNNESLYELILGSIGGLTVDHKNGDIFDYQKENLRLATYSQQLANRRKVGKSPSSQFKGVYWHKQRQYFVASITCSGTYRYLGHFTSEIKAARAYDKAAKEFYGEFAKLNFPEVCH